MAKEQWWHILAGLLLIVLVINLIILFQTEKLLEQPAMKKETVLLPPALQLTAIVPENCPECFSILPVVEIIKQQPLQIKEERVLQAASAEAKALIEAYKIRKLPTIILTGEINRTNLAGFVPANDGLVYLQAPAPYQLVSGELVGRVHARIIEEPGCALCDNLSQIPIQLQQIGVLITQEIVDATSDNGKALIQQYKIKKLPAMLLSKDASAYPMIVRAWQQLGTVEEDETFVMRELLPPYIELPSRKLRGTIELILLTDKSCAACYDARLHARILAQYGLIFSINRTEDIATEQGKSIAMRYNITAIPTALIRGDVGAYAFLTSRWKSFGSIEKDGTYVFRQLDMIPGITYKNLKNNTLVTTPPPPNEQEGM